VTAFDLLFVILFLGGMGTLVAALAAALRGRRTTALALLRRVGMSIVVYLGVVVIVSLVSPRRVVAVGDEQCSDDWCVAVADVHRTAGVSDVAYHVTFRLSSRARRVAQRERGVVVYLRDGTGRRYDPDPTVGAVPFDVRLEPLQQINTARTFHAPPRAFALGVVVARAGFPFPGCCIIGDQGSLFHKRTVVRID
jgi:pimeloyl-ACP methyl ester carboxylesterase